MGEGEGRGGRLREKGEETSGRGALVRGKGAGGRNAKGERGKGLG